MKRYLILVHRYLGIAACVLMAAWCLSGIVMLYVGYPVLDEQERIAALPTLDFKKCCRFDEAAAALGDVEVDDFAVEMMADRPVVRAADGYATVTADLQSGELIGYVSLTEAARIASDHVHARSLRGTAKYLSRVESDQWTVTGQYDGDRPMYLFELPDRSRTQIYVSAMSGKIVLDTTRGERFWNWLGAVVHWIYPAKLRQNVAVWAQVVIWTSLVGIFLTITGLWLGVMQIRAGRNGKFSPYRGYNRWHHVSGLIFGIILLAWVASGLVSMTPWGFLAGGGPDTASQRLRGVAYTTGDALAAVRRLVEKGADHDLLRISAAPFGGHLFLALRTPNATRRVDAKTIAEAPLASDEVRRVAAVLEPAPSSGGLQVLPAGDQYYYDDHDGRRVYPVYRVIADDAQHTRYYLEASTGALLQRTDRDARWYRWLFEAFHRWDFIPALRRHPWLDLVVLPLLLGATALCVTGIVLGFRRVTPRPASARPQWLASTAPD